jgi:hypothetical protein
MILAAPLVIPFAEAVGISIATLGMAKGADMVNDYIQENPEKSAMILKTLVPNLGIGEIFMNKEKISLEDLEEMTDEEAQDLSKEEKAELMKQAGKSGGGKNKRQTMIDLSEKLGLSGEGKEKQDIEYEVDERYDEGGVEDAPKPKFDYKKFFRKRRADGGAIGIEVLFEEKKPRKDFNIGGQAQKTNTTPYDARASVQDYAAAMQKVGAGTDAQKLQAIGEYGLNQMQNSPSYFKAVGQGINQHMLNNQMLRDAFDAKRITEDQYKLMGGYDVAKLTPKIGLGNIKIGGTPGDVGIASALYNAIKAGGIGLEKLGIKETDPYNQYGDIGFFGSIAKNYQGAKGLSESDKTLYGDIISGKTQSDIDRFRSGLYAANQVDKATGDRLYGGNIEKLFNEYKQSPSTFFYAGDDTQNMYDRFNKYYADGGRVGLFMGGPALEGQALNIYNSMNSYGFSDQEIANALQGQGLYTPPGSGAEPPTTIQPVGFQTGSDNFSPYNPDPNKIQSFKTDPRIAAANEADVRTKQLTSMGINDPFANEASLSGAYYGDMPEDTSNQIGKQSMFAKAKQGLTGLMDNPLVNLISSSTPFGMVKNLAKGIGSKLPVNQRAIQENVMGNLGFAVNDIGQIVSTGDYDDESGDNVMAGYNLNRMTVDTFKNRIDKIRNRKAAQTAASRARIAAIQEAQRKFELGQKLKADALLEAQLKKAQQEIAAKGYQDYGQGGADQATQDSYEGSDGSYAGASTQDYGGGEKDGGIIGYRKGGLATMFVEKR